MATVFDIANFFIDLANKTDDDYITNLKLNKLLYYAQGVSLARRDKTLFEEDIEAWKYGPVIPSIYKKYKDLGKMPIQETDANYTPEVFTAQEIGILLDVMREFGIFTGGKLVSLTHAPDTPWSKSFSNNERIISNKDIKSYFINHPVKEFCLKKDIPLVKELPKEWYDPNEDSIWEAYL